MFTSQAKGKTGSTIGRIPGVESQCEQKLKAEVKSGNGRTRVSHCTSGTVVDT